VRLLRPDQYFHDADARPGQMNRRIHPVIGHLGQFNPVKRHHPLLGPFGLEPQIGNAANFSLFMVTFSQLSR